ncbi:HdaA/DnaA family protein [Succinivibrio dextrinosolvens]|uniref:HdaA/DnaA family protein n=1 Tax=Succinivibrio dextrinosolvens TaxID=83771 RepID=UPI00241F3297|nr:DnaA/Hda family protein [Succinivibrio dextrinosolvens]MBE6423164.1 hypothetical protein [Succinivibrio dextrinosolvens]
MEEKNKVPYQQALDFKISDKSDFSTFVEGSNSYAVSSLKHAVENEVNEFYYYFGPEGCGKTHLLNALFQLKSDQIQNVFFLDLNLAKTLGPIVLDVDLPKNILLDNVDAIAGDEQFEISLFGLYNRWYDRREGTLIMTGKTSFDTIPFKKKDLTTRLSSGVKFQLNYLNEDECIEAITKRAQYRHFNLPENTATFLVRHFNRDMRSLVELLDRLEKAQIEQSHYLTIPFVKSLLNL